ncbi:MAG: phosphatidate cytidylyltransferase, partial [Actinomycetes bacterium]
GGATDSILATGLGVWWIVLALGHAIMLRDLGHGGGMVLDALVGTFAMDTGAYFAGRSFGTKPLAPRISPKKTVEGLFGGAVATVAVLLIASLYQPWLGVGNAIAIGLVIAILAPAGDLFESIIKRDAGAKDTSRILGPHGGLLDRLDGVLFSIVGVYWLWLLVGS